MVAINHSRLLRFACSNDPSILPVGLQRPGVALTRGVLLSESGVTSESDRASAAVQPADVIETYVLDGRAISSVRQVPYPWQLQMPDAACPAYRLTPPTFMDARGTIDVPAARESASQALTALSQLMLPGLPVPRQVVIQDDTLDINVADPISEVIAACQGMGLGTVSMPTYERSWELGTSAPMFVGAHLLVDPAAHRQLATTMLDYMRAVLAHGAPPFEFHLCAFQDDAPTGASAAVSDRDVRHLLRTLARDERLAKGNGHLGAVMAVGGALVVLAGAMALMVHNVYNGPIGLDTTPTAFWTVVGGVVATCGGGVLAALENHHSTQPPAIPTSFQLCVWPDPDRESPSPLVLHRTRQGAGMRTVIG